MLHRLERHLDCTMFDGATKNAEIRAMENLANLFEQRVDLFFERNRFFKRWRCDVVTKQEADWFCCAFADLVRQFPTIIALVVSNIFDEKMRVPLVVNLYQECGEGNANATHFQIFRRFLKSARIEGVIDACHPLAANWAASHRQFILSSNNAQTLVGLVASSEFLAQPALGAIFRAIEPLYPKGVDWSYFTDHLELEKVHVDDITRLIAQAVSTPEERKWLLSGFDYGLLVWNKYFEGLSENLLCMEDCS